MTTQKPIQSIALTIICAAVLAACGGGGGGNRSEYAAAYAR